MNDRELLEYIAAQVGGLTAKVDGLENTMNDGFNSINSRLTKIETTIENEVKPKIKMCLDEIVSVKEKQTEHDSRFDRIESKIEIQDVEISVIKRVK